MFGFLLRPTILYCVRMIDELTDLRPVYGMCGPKAWKVCSIQIVVSAQDLISGKASISYQPLRITRHFRRGSVPMLAQYFVAHLLSHQ